MYLNGKQLYNNSSRLSPKQEKLYSFNFKNNKELATLPDISMIAPGSILFLLDTNETYILDLNKNWRKVIQEEKKEETFSNYVVYDGGELD